MTMLYDFTVIIKNILYTLYEIKPLNLILHQVKMKYILYLQGICNHKKKESDKFP